MILKVSILTETGKNLPNNCTITKYHFDNKKRFNLMLPISMAASGGARKSAGGGASAFKMPELSDVTEL